MKKVYTLILCFTYAFLTYAINPSKQYSYTPEKLDLVYEEIMLKTDDGTNINVWHLPSTTIKRPLIISQSDAGNMGDWLYLGMYLQAYGIDVWMYDYRGFGKSSDFSINRNQLYYTEYVLDLSAVVNYVYQQTSMEPALMGISMGTIIVNEYLSNTTHKINNLILDGFVNDPTIWKERLQNNGKYIVLPQETKFSKKAYKRKNILYLVASDDKYSFLQDIPHRKSSKVTIKEFKSEHISSFMKYPKEYSREIQLFMAEHDN